MNREPLFLVDWRAIVAQNSLDIGRFRWQPGVFGALSRIKREGPFLFYLTGPEEGVEPYLSHLLDTLSGEHVDFEEIRLGCTPEEIILEAKDDIRYDFAHSVLVSPRKEAGGVRNLVLSEHDWDEIACLLLGDGKHLPRKARVQRTTKETSITLSLNLDGSGKGRFLTGIGFFDHMLEQVVKHTGVDVEVEAKGDLEVDEHHTVEDVAIVLGAAVLSALGDKRGISRYGCEVLTMDDVRATVALDFSGRPDFVWDCPFSRDYVGTFPTEMVEHFFKSFSDEARCNLHMSVTKGNTHHQAEALFKAFSHALRQAVRRYYWTDELPSTKGSL